MRAESPLLDLTDDFPNSAPVMLFGSLEYQQQKAYPIGAMFLDSTTRETVPDYALLRVRVPELRVAGKGK